MLGRQRSSRKIEAKTSVGLKRVEVSPKNDGRDDDPFLLGMVTFQKLCETSGG